ncbi:MAG: M48 family metalloprotease [Terriglobales bacterium]
MKRWLPIVLVVLVGAGALLYSEYTKDKAAAGPDSFLNWLAQTQRQTARIPLRATRLSDAEESRIGAELAARYRAQLRADWNESTDAPIERYINEVGARLVGGTTQASAIIGLRTRRKLTYQFYYIPGKHFINAFALPGGHIFMGEGLYRLLQTEDELAAVLGHEVEHIDLFHCAERVQIEARLRHLPLSGLIQLPFSIFQAGYGKDQELQSDREGTLLAVHAGYSAQGAIGVFEIFQRLRQRQERAAKNPGDELSRLAWQTLAGYFRSHPPPDERIRKIQQLMDDRKLPVRSERRLRLRAPVSTT